jgi:hypothetical protein
MTLDEGFQRFCSSVAPSEHHEPLNLMSQCQITEDLNPCVYVTQFIVLFTALRQRIVKSRHCQPGKTILSLFPALVWLPKYDWKTNITSDIVAGVTVAVMHIPQGNSTFVTLNFASNEKQSKKF